MLLKSSTSYGSQGAPKMKFEDLPVKYKRNTPEQIVKKFVDSDKLLNVGADIAAVVK